MGRVGIRSLQALNALWAAAKTEGAAEGYFRELMGGCQNNYGPFLGTLNSRCRIIVGIQKGTIILTTTLMFERMEGLRAS